MLGAERLVHGKMAGSAVTVRIDATLAAPKVGDVVSLQGPPERFHWFDAATGRRL
jgi:sn-glycerol 3-phosphate transport system ATP-binding protein